MKPGTLYLIPNTLGTSTSDTNSSLNPLLSTIPQEVISITAKLAYFIAENAKTARAHFKLIAQSEALSRPIQEIMISELNTRTLKTDLPNLLAPILAGEDGGLISEAGVPAVADPGADLVKLAHDSGITVRPLVGPSSILLALMGSGLSGQNFAFNGYLPTDTAQRTRQIKMLEERSKRDRQTQLFIETPYRNQALLEAMCNSCQPDTRLCVASDLTLTSETITTLPIMQWKQRLKKGTLPDFQRKPTLFLFQAA